MRSPRRLVGRLEIPGEDAGQTHVAVERRVHDKIDAHRPCDREGLLVAGFCRRIRFCANGDSRKAGLWNFSMVRLSTRPRADRLPSAGKPRHEVALHEARGDPEVGPEKRTVHEDIPAGRALADEGERGERLAVVVDHGIVPEDLLAQNFDPFGLGARPVHPFPMTIVIFPREIPSASSRSSSGRRRPFSPQ